MSARAYLLFTPLFSWMMLSEEERRGPGNQSRHRQGQMMTACLESVSLPKGVVNATTVDDKYC